MFTFENLGGVDNRAIQVLMRNVESDLLMTALKGAGEEVKDKFLDNMSQRARDYVPRRYGSQGPHPYHRCGRRTKIYHAPCS